MKRAMVALILLSLSFTATTLLTVKSDSAGFSGVYPAVVCPPAMSGTSSQISISSRKTQFQRLDNRSTKTNAFNTLRYPNSKDSLIVSATGVTPTIWLSRAGMWAGGVICSGPTSSQWFVGGSSDVRTRGSLIVINSGLSDAIVDVQTFSENGRQHLKSLDIKAKSLLVVTLDTLATGDRMLAVHIVPRSGRINAFMIDVLGSGLKSLGGDFVNPITSESNLLIIPAIPNQIVKKGGKNLSTHTLRILSTSDMDANFTAEVLSSDGSFIPVGLNSQKINSGRVSEFSLAPKISANAFAVRITSDEPVVAAISSTITLSGHKEFVWSTPTPALVPMAMAVTGLSPVIAFAGNSISVQVQVTLINGKNSIATITGSDIALWRVPQMARSISILGTSPDTYAGALVVSADGFGYIPIMPGSLLTKVEIPRSNIRVLNP